MFRVQRILTVLFLLNAIVWGQGRFNHPGSLNNFNTSTRYDDFYFRIRKSFHDYSQNHHAPQVPGMSLARSSETTKELIALQLTIPDFQVNENAGGATQISPVVACDSSGNSIIVWADDRNGDIDIYAQRFAANGSPIGSNFRVNSDISEAWQHFPAVATDKQGNFVIVWVDEREGTSYIYAQIFSKDGNRVGDNFKVDADNNTPSNQSSPAVAFSHTGRILFVWQDDRNGNPDIYAQFYNMDGTKLGSAFLINDDDGNGNQYNPAVATDANGNFIVVWRDTRNNIWDIYAQRIKNDGSFVNSNFRVNDDNSNSWKISPAVAFDNSGNFAVAWEDFRNGDGDIYIQRYQADGTLLGTNIKVNDDSQSKQQSNPAVTFDDAGNFFVVWEDERNGNKDIFAQKFDASGNAISVNFQLNDDNNQKNQKFPAVAFQKPGNFIVVWEDDRNDYGDIYLQPLSSNGTLIGTNSKINDDVNSAWQYYPAIALDNAGNFVVVWEDERNGDGDIYAQRFSQDGTRNGSNFRVNSDNTSAWQMLPAVGMDSSGNFTVVWIDFQNNAGGIYGQQYHADGTKIGSNFQISDNNASIIYQNPIAIAVNGTGDAIVVWQDNRNGNSDIYAQYHKAGSATNSNNFRVNDDNGTAAQRSPVVGIDKNGNFVIVWQDERNGDADIYAQRYSADGTPQGNNFQINDGGSSTWQGSPAMTMDSVGNFIVVWASFAGGENIFARRFQADGTSLGPSFQVNDNNNSRTSSPSIAMDKNGNFIVTWVDWRDGDENIYAQRFEADGTPVGGNFRVNSNTNKAQFSPDVKLWKGQIYNVWVSNHVGGTGYDIWANVLDWNNPTTFLSQSDYTTVTKFQLFPNFPNPFNPSTTITFDLSKTQKVLLEIFDLSGRLIKTLVNEKESSGFHQVVWDGTDNTGQPVASGIYLYRLKVANRSQTRKMFLLR